MSHVISDTDTKRRREGNGREISHGRSYLWNGANQGVSHPHVQVKPDVPKNCNCKLIFDARTRIFLAPAGSIFPLALNYYKIVYNNNKSSLTVVLPTFRTHALLPAHSAFRTPKMNDAIMLGSIVR